MKTASNLHFDQMSSLYDDVRPSYPEVIFDRIELFSPTQETSRILEIGCGSGKATESLIRRWSCLIDAIEPGPELLKIAQERLNKSGRACFHHSTFDEFCDFARYKYDLVVAATSFHWLDPKTKFERCRQIMTEQGRLAVFWTNFLVADEHVAEQLDEIYREHSTRKGATTGTLIERTMRKIEERREEVQSSGHFKLVESHLADSFLVMNSARYLQLLKTFPDHNETNFREIGRMLGRISEYIKSCCDSITVRVIVNTEMAISA